MRDIQPVLEKEASKAEIESDIHVENESNKESPGVASQFEIEVHPSYRTSMCKSKPVKRLFSQLEDFSSDDFDFSEENVMDARDLDFPAEAGPSHVLVFNDSLRCNTITNQSSKDSQDFEYLPGSGLIDESETGKDDVLEKDSDWESSDGVEFTRERMRRKRLRHSKRCHGKQVILHEIEGNKEAYEEFRNYMDKTRIFTPKKKKPVGISNQKRLNKLHPTIEKTLGHIFTYEDSLLNFLSNKNSTFRMKDHCSFASSNFRTLEHPLDWVEDPSFLVENDPGRQLEKLKAHAQYRQYLRYKLDKEDVDNDASLTRSRNIGEGLERIERSVSSMKLFKKYTISVNQSKVARDNAKLLLDPNKHMNEIDCVEKWMKSESCRQLTEEYEKYT